MKFRSSNLDVALTKLAGIGGTDAILFLLSSFVFFPGNARSSQAR